MSQHINGHGAVDLAAVKALADQNEQLEAHREQITQRLLADAGLICLCGERLRSDTVYYFAVVKEQVAETADGPQLGLNLRMLALHSRDCVHAIVAEQSAIARRQGPSGAITWLDERRQARAHRTGE